MTSALLALFLLAADEAPPEPSARFGSLSGAAATDPGDGPSAGPSLARDGNTNAAEGATMTATDSGVGPGTPSSLATSAVDTRAASLTRPVAPLASAAFFTTAILTAAAATTLSVIAAGAITGAPVDATGRPSPIISTLGVAVGVGLNFGTIHVTLPLLTRFVDGDVSSSRTGAWRLSRWGLAAQGVGVVAMAIGSGLEAREFGSGQSLLLSGIVTALLGALAVDVLELVGAWQERAASQGPR